MPHPVDIHVGRRVAERRIDRGLTQADLAKALGLTFQQIQKYEKGANRISASKLWLTAGFLGVDIGFFFARLPTASEGAAEPDGPAFDYGLPVSRTSLAITKLAPALSEDQQRLMTNLMREMVSKPAAGE